MDRYKGYQTIILNDETLANFYTDQSILPIEVLENEYIVIENEAGEVVDKYCYQNGKYRPLHYKAVISNHAGKFKSKNLQQDLAFDMLQDQSTPIKILTGRFGSGQANSHILQ